MTTAASDPGGASRHGGALRLVDVRQAPLDRDSFCCREIDPRKMIRQSHPDSDVAGPHDIRMCAWFRQARRRRCNDLDGPVSGCSSSMSPGGVVRNHTSFRVLRHPTGLCRSAAVVQPEHIDLAYGL